MSARCLQEGGGQKCTALCQRLTNVTTLGPSATLQPMYRCIVFALSLSFTVACSNESAPVGRDADASESLSPAEAVNRPRPRRPRPPGKLNTKAPPFAISASHILIQYKGATKAKTSRSKAEARRLAEKVLVKAKSGDAFRDLAREFSDAPDKAGGGYLGIFRPWKQYPQFNEAVAAVGYDEVAPTIVETDLGFHVVKREKTIHIGHVLVIHKKARNAHMEITRNQDEARAEAERLRKQLAADGADWAAIARKSSDCALTKAIGGDLGYYGKGVKTLMGGRLLPRLVPAVMGLDPGEVSKVNETEFGFHVVWRYPDPARGELGSTTTGDAGQANGRSDDGGVEADSRLGGTP